MMSSVICLLGVSMTHFQPGDETWGYLEWFEKDGVTGGHVYNPDGCNMEELFEVLKVDSSCLVRDPLRTDKVGLLRAKEEWAEFGFCHMGEMYGEYALGEYASPLQWLMEDIGPEDVITEEDWATLFNMGKQLLAGTQTKCSNEPFTANFVTVWEYNSERDYWGDYDEWWTLLGRLDMSKLPIVEE